MSEVKVSVLKNGPLKVEGAIELLQDGSPLALQGTTAFLCRCGASANKPFCDGSHSRTGFSDVPTAGV
ncbi:MAG: CDGSH iron-sulfur domain-containing protein [Proteobacteria bacterium]|nr:CDGSH iron-sulfur domain-containing protein [Pseudomonadota bacterium]